MSRRSEREADRAAERARVKAETQRLVAEGIEAGTISALTWHGELPWTEQEHRQLMVVEVEARATGIAAQATDTPWHELTTHERMRYRSAAYTVAQVEVGWAL